MYQFSNLAGRDPRNDVLTEHLRIDLKPKILFVVNVQIGFSTLHFLFIKPAPLA